MCVYFQQMILRHARAVRAVCGMCAVVLISFPVHAFAAASTPAPLAGIPGGRLSMTLTPPLYQLSLLPGSTWSSTLKFSNNNPYDLVVYAFTQNFRATEESGVSLLPSGTVPGANAYELASWITPQGGALTVKQGATINIPFTISIPKNAEPGGHYAAIIVGTTPSRGDGGDVSVGAQLSSLLLVRVIGDVLERGMIEDFAAAQSVVQTQAVSFSLQFKNTGNVHVAPEGAIVITNMFGRERGRVAIDGQNPFGNVLPNSSRKFVFDWKGEWNFFDIGRYAARVSLRFGDGAAQHVHYTAHFWVLPWIPFCILSGSFIFLAWFMRIIARRYVVRALLLEEQRTGSDRTKIAQPTFVPPQPLLIDTRDLSVSPRGSSFKEEVRERIAKSSLLRIFHIRRFTILPIFMLVLSLLLISYYFYQVFQDERSYQMTVQKDGGGQLIVTSHSAE